jgi:hypothetical protein
LINSAAEFIMFAPFQIESYSNRPATWTNWCGIASVNAANPITGPGNFTPFEMPTDQLGLAAEVVPAALTVQVMNPSALQAADGIFAMARVNQQLSLGRSLATWEDMRTRFISYYSPRLLSAGKLALRGVKCDSYPLDMSEYSQFCQVFAAPSYPELSPIYKSAALAPIVFVQNNVTPVAMQFMVTIEWRVRFDPGNPATASHVHHDTTSDSTWNTVVKVMSSAGHGIEELAEGVSAVGSLARGVGRLIG